MKRLTVRVLIGVCTFILGVIAAAVWLSKPAPNLSLISPVSIKVEAPQPPAKVTKEMAVATAKAHYFGRKDVLRDVDVDASDEPDGWHISFYPRVRRGTIFGGGRVYQIDNETGKILNLKLYQ